MASKNIAKEEVIQIASRIRKKFSLHLTDPQEIFKKIFDYYRGNIKYIDERDRVETLVVDSDGAWKIFVSNKSSKVRNNFTIAHELGHYFLHFLHTDKCAEKDSAEPKPIVFNRKGSNRQEWEANWFAAEFLMPKDAFRAAAKEFSGDIGKLARKFHVSKDAASVRLKTLDIM